MTTVVFAVTLRHLSWDATVAGFQLPDVERTAVESAELRRLLERLTELAPRVSNPTRPELRIASPHGTFIVHVRDGRVGFSSWRLRGARRDLSPHQIYAAITGLEDAADLVDSVSGPPPAADFPPRQRRVKTVLALGILSSNALTAWFICRPAPDLLPAHRLVAVSTGQRVLAHAAGDYQTGQLEGDRVLRIDEKGAVRWQVLGPAGNVVEEEKFTTQVVDLAGKTGLLTSSRAMIEIDDPVTLTFFGDTYLRK